MMDPIVFGVIGLVALFVLLAAGVPVGAGMGIIGTIGIWYLISGSAAINKLIVVPFTTVASYELAVLPLFILMAEFIFVTGMGADLYNLSAKWLGHQRGGLAQASIVACAGFSAVSASSLATTATMGLVARPEMEKYNYKPQLATGCIAAGGSLGSLIPPSGILIIYGTLTETSIGKLFIAGIVPGILEAVFYMITIYILCLRDPSLGPRGALTTFKEKIFAFKSCGEIILLIMLILGGLLLGWFTPTECGAIGAAAALLISIARRRLSWVKFKEAIFRTISTTGVIYFILIGAFILNNFLAVSNIPTALATFANDLPLSPIGIIVIIMLMYLFLGCFIDTAAMHVLTTPIFFPVAITLGFDPLWFGIIVTRAMEIALITPPIGMNVYVMAGIAPDVPMQTIFKGVVPFIIADIFNVILLLFVPSTILFLPNLMK